MDYLQCAFDNDDFECRHETFEKIANEVGNFIFEIYVLRRVKKDEDKIFFKVLYPYREADVLWAIYRLFALDSPPHGLIRLAWVENDGTEIVLYPPRPIVVS